MHHYLFIFNLLGRQPEERLLNIQSRCTSSGAWLFTRVVKRLLRVEDKLRLSCLVPLQIKGDERLLSLLFGPLLRNYLYPGFSLRKLYSCP